MGPLSISLNELELSNNNGAATGAVAAASFLLWNATDYALISGTDKILINLI